MSSWIVFGGEDQRQTQMASNNTRRATRNTTNIVVRNGPAPNQGATAPTRGTGRRRNVQRRARQQQRSQVTVRVQPSQNSRRRRVPNRTRVNNRVVYQKINTTLGTVGANGTGAIETELAVLLNPCTMKEQTGSNSYGPVQIYASTYSLFQMRSLTLTLKPLVGDSAVSGTAVRMSWNPTSNPTQTSWSALGARKHSDTTPGRTGKFHLSFRDLKGPKDGWYKTNPKGDPMLSFAGSIEIHTLGETRSTYQNNQYTGGLFLAELETVWAFKDYAQQPGLMNLLKGESQGEAQITTDTDGKIILEAASTSALARAASTTSASEIIWMVTDTVINAGANVFPPPFSWLLRGGWWFLKRVAGAPVRNGTERFEVFASINDARANVPCISTQASMGAVTIGSLHFQQITPGNAGIGSDIPQVVRAIEQQPIDTTTRIHAYSGMYDTSFIPGYHVLYEKNNVPRSERGLAVPVQEGYITTYNYGKVEIGDRSAPSAGIPVYLATSNTNRTQIGLVVSGVSKTIVNSGTPMTLSTLLFYCTESRNYDFTQSNDGLFRVADLSYSQAQAQVALRTRTVNRRKVLVASGNWYVLQFFCYGTAHETYRVDTPTVTEIRTPANPWPTAETTITYTPDEGAAAAGLTPGYSTSIELGDIQTYTVTRYARAIVDEDEFHDMPPLEEDEDADDEADEDLTDEQLEMGPFDDYDTPPMSRLVVHPDARKTYELLLELYSEREARLAVNQLKPSDEYKEFVALYHDALVDGLSPRSARAHALGI